MTLDPVETPALSVRPRLPAGPDDRVSAPAPVHARSRHPVDRSVEPGAWPTPATLPAARVAEHGGRAVGHVAPCRGDDGDPAASSWAAHGNAVPAVGANRLFVTPRARGPGAGAALMGRAVGKACSRGLHPVLDVVATDPAAVPCARLGRRDLGRAGRSWGPDQVVALRCCAAPVSAERAGRDSPSPLGRRPADIVAG